MKRNFDIFLPMIMKLNKSFQEMGQLWLEESVFSEKKKKERKKTISINYYYIANHLSRLENIYLKFH